MSIETRLRRASDDARQKITGLTPPTIRQHRRRAVLGWAVTGIAVVLLTVFIAPRLPTNPPTDESQTTFTTPDSPITLTTTGADFRDKCVAAADLLGFAVPCPHTIPFQTGSQYCQPSGENEDTPCVSSGTFVVELSESRSQDAQKALSHFVIEGSKFDPLCDNPIPTNFGLFKGSLVECGGGIHHDSVAFMWSDDGVFYTVSARGDRQTGIDAIGIVVQDIEMVEPMTPPAASPQAG